MNVEYCLEDKDVKKLLKELDEEIIAADTETTDLDPLLDHSFLRLIQLKSSNKIVLFDRKHLSKKSDLLISEFLTRKGRKVIFHNAKFDIKWLKIHLNVGKFFSIYCTYLASKLIAAGTSKKGHSLQALVKKYFNVELDKDTRTSGWNQEYLDDRQIRYAAEDVEYLHALRELQIEKLKELKLIQTAIIEFNCVEPVAQMELNGIGFDFEQWFRTARRNKVRMVRLQNKIKNLLAPQNQQFTLFQDFNRSNELKITDQGLIDYFNEHNIPLPKKINKQGIEVDTVAMEHLATVAHEHPSFPLIIKHASIKKSVTSYGESWAEWKHPKTGRIHPNFNQIGTDTGRFAANDPNPMQFPQSNVYRRCIMASEGKMLIWGDYSQMELRILAEFSQDKQMIKAFTEGLDLHTYTASLVFKVPYDKVREQKILRIRAKNLNFGIVYGIGAKRFAENSGISESEAEELMANYFRVYKGMHEWLEWARKEAIVFKRSRTLSGRLMIHEFDEDDFKQKSKAGRNGMNMPIQGSNADITKIALSLLYERHSETIHTINVIHDEAIAEADENGIEESALKMERCLVDAAEQLMKIVPVKVDMHMAKRWRK